VVVPSDSVVGGAPTASSTSAMVRLHSTLARRRQAEAEHAERKIAE